jgi:hypothetical protein
MPLGEKILHYENKNADLAALQGKIEDYLNGDGFQTQCSVPSPHGTLIQAKKGGFLSAIISADRAMTILIDGEPNNFTVRIGIGKWLEHLGVAAVETLLLSSLFIFVDVPEIAWNLHIEGQIAKQIASFVG